MKNKTTNQEYKNFLEYKIQDRKNKIFLSLEKEFLNYLTVAKILNYEAVGEDEKNFTNFFTRILKNVFFSSLYKKLTPAFLNKINSFQKRSYQSLSEKKFKKVVIVSDKKVSRQDPGVEEFAKMVTQDWKVDLFFRSLPQHDNNWFVNNIVSEINRDLFIKAISNVLKKYPRVNLGEKYLDLKKVSDAQLNKLWTKFVDTRVWYSYERFIKANEMLGDHDIVNKLNDIYSLIDDETLLIVYNNNEEQNSFFDYLFNFENELFNYINNKKNLSILIISKQNTYKNTFLGLLSLANVEMISEVKDLSIDYNYGEDTIDFSDYNLDNTENYSNTIEIFSDKKNIVRKKSSMSKPKKKDKRKNITDLTKTMSLTSENNSSIISNEGDSGTLDQFWNNNSKKLSSRNTKTIEEIDFTKNENDDLMKPITDEDTSFINDQLKTLLSNDAKETVETKTTSSKIIDTPLSFDDEPSNTTSTINFDVLKNIDSGNSTDIYDVNITDEHDTSEFNFDQVVTNSRKESLLNLIKYHTTFKIFLNNFNFVRSKYKKLNFNQGATKNNFETKLKNLNLEGTYDFLNKNAPTLFDILYSRDVTKNELARCISIYNHVLKKFSDVTELIENNNDIKEF